MNISIFKIKDPKNCVYYLRRYDYAKNNGLALINDYEEIENYIQIEFPNNSNSYSVLIDSEEKEHILSHIATKYRLEMSDVVSLNNEFFYFDKIRFRKIKSTHNFKKILKI